MSFDDHSLFCSIKMRTQNKSPHVNAGEDNVKWLVALRNVAMNINEKWLSDIVRKEGD